MQCKYEKGGKGSNKGYDITAENYKDNPKFTKKSEYKKAKQREYS